MVRKYLSDFEKTDPFKVLESFDNSRPLLIVILIIYLQIGETGLLEERGIWIRQIWDEILSVSDEIGGCRLQWTELFFAAYATNKSKVFSELKSILYRMKQPSLQSFCISSEISGTVKEQLDIINNMIKELSAKRNFGMYPAGMIRLIDGELIEV